MHAQERKKKKEKRKKKKEKRKKAKPLSGIHKFNVFDLPNSSLQNFHAVEYGLHVNGINILDVRT
jgi:urate oxidase